MKKYDRCKPLIVIHIPKAGGTSSQKIFREWFGSGFLRHYFDEQAQKLPLKYDLEALHSSERPVLLHGHFNRFRHFGVEDYYPDAKQFITILRDPFELTVSHYFFTRTKRGLWNDQSRIPDEDLSSHLASAKPNMLNHFPRIVTQENYKEILEKYFIEIGITEDLGESMNRIACCLNKPFNVTLLNHLNRTTRDQETPPGTRAAFRENNPLEYLVYDYVVKNFRAQ